MLSQNAYPYNRLLAALPPAEFQHLQEHLDLVTLKFGTLLYEAGAPIACVYFPTTALVSMLALVPGHEGLEIAMVGREGMVGTALAMGQRHSALRTIVQCTGNCLRLEASHFLACFDEQKALRRAVLRYAQLLTQQMAENAACNHYHAITQRLARWLLMAQDRVGSDQFHLTQEFLGNMLGVRRAGVTAAAHRLKTLGLIDYSRGDIEVLDTEGLATLACSCYHKVE